MRRRAIRIGLILGPILLILLAWGLFFTPHTATMPFTYNPEQGSLRLLTKIAGQPHALAFNSLLPKTVVSQRLYQQLSQQAKGLDRTNPSAEITLGSYRSRIFYESINEAELRPHIDGVLGIDPFVPDASFESHDRHLGARLTLDFKANLMKVEDGKTLKPLNLPKGTLQTPLMRDGDGPYYMLLPLNNGITYPFALGIGCRDVVIPSGSVLFPNLEGTGYVNASGVVPVTVTLDGHDLSVQAVAMPGIQAVGVFGMSLLSNYRVIIDFRNKRLYLEPADSSSDL